MEIKTELNGTAIIVVLEGRIIPNDIESLQMAVGDAIKKMMRSDTTAVIMDLSSLSYINSSGLQFMLSLAKTLFSQHAQFMLCAINDSVREVFEISGFARVIPMHATQADAIATVRK